MNSNPEDEPAIDREVQEALLDSLSPVEPERKAAIRKRIFESINAQPQVGLVTISAHEGEWIEIAPGVRLKKLLRSGNIVADLFRMEPRSSLPGHEHPEPEECICLEGEVSLGGTMVRAGDFHYAPQGLPHGPIYSATGCLLYVRTARPI